MSNEMKKPIKSYVTAPNIITSVRIIGAIVLFFLKIETIPFYIVYGVCGVSDGVDGFVARRTNSTSSFGKKLDSAADLLFYFVMAYKMLNKLLDTLHPVVSWIIFGLLIMRLSIYVFAALKFKTFLTSHSLLNKATGLIVFLIPYTIPYENFFFYYSIFGCAVALLANLYEIFSYVRAAKKNVEPE